MSVTANLFHALCRIRDVSETLTRWIDAVCINQSSTTERTQQVRLMIEMYTKAKKTVMWLGEDAHPNLEMLFKVAKARHEYARFKHIIERPGGRMLVFLYSNDLESMKIVANVRDRYASKCMWVYEDARCHHVPPDSDPKLVTVAFRDLETGEAHGGPEYVILALDLDKPRVQTAEKESFPDFCTLLLEAIKPAEFGLTDAQCLGTLSVLDYIASRPYWRRAWIVQEAIVSEKATLVCGKHEIDFDVFCLVYGYKRSTELDVKNVVLDDLDRTRGQSKQMRDLTLGRLMGVFGEQWATDPRDLIFSLVGLLRHFSELPLHRQWAKTSIDYSLDVQTAFKKVSQHSIDTLIENDANIQGDHLVLSGHIVDTVTMTTDIGHDENFYNEVDLLSYSGGTKSWNKF
ncbi:heterokaryon incompatibility protein domain-containing protein [Trichoderma pleuroticola]